MAHGGAQVALGMGRQHRPNEKKKQVETEKEAPFISKKLQKLKREHLPGDKEVDQVLAGGQDRKDTVAVDK